VICIILLQFTIFAIKYYEVFFYEKEKSFWGVSYEVPSLW
jgi:hypothetical protein